MCLVWVTTKCLNIYKIDGSAGKGAGHQVWPEFSPWNTCKRSSLTAVDISCSAWPHTHTHTCTMSESPFLIVYITLMTLYLSGFWIFVFPLSTYILVTEISLLAYLFLSVSLCSFGRLETSSVDQDTPNSQVSACLWLLHSEIKAWDITSRDIYFRDSVLYSQAPSNSVTKDNIDPLLWKC